MSAQDRSRNGARVGPGPWCGTAGGYTNHLCRCDRCRAAWAADHLRYMNAHPEQREKHRERLRRAYAAKKATS